jgi:hypothetical protein
VGKIGTTGRGIGPAYESKVGRYGIRVADLVDPDVLKQKIEFTCAERNAVLRGVYHREIYDLARLYEDYLRFGEILGERIVNGTVRINEKMRLKKRVMPKVRRARCSTSITDVSVRDVVQHDRRRHLLGPSASRRSTLQRDRRREAYTTRRRRRFPTGFQRRAQNTGGATSSAR